ncbi:MAG: PhoH family protein [Pseudomonadota bacterium]
MMLPTPIREKLIFEDNGALIQVCGANGKNFQLLEKEMGVEIHLRGNELILVGEKEQVELGRSLFRQFYALAQKGRSLDSHDLIQAVRAVQADSKADIKGIFSDDVLVTPGGVRVTSKGPGQKKYVDAIRSHDIVFAIGPAGTGKTYLGMAMAISALMNREVKRIILTRPAVEAGERLGFLPGDMLEKVNPYLRPLYDALDYLMEIERAQQLLSSGKIEVAPLAFMRGRTLNGSFVILDEAQNTTSEQMLMFLTRLGFDSKAVITGDITQVDLPNGIQSGLAEARRLLSGIKGIAFCEFTERDVVRHPLVQQIIKAYEMRGENPK